MPRERDVQAFHDRASTYETDWRGKMHHDITARTLDIALAVNPTPRQVLDVGCGTGVLLRLLAARLPRNDQELFGIDAAAGMIEVAKSRTDDSRIHFSIGNAEDLPYPDGHFDLVVSTTSFDHWEDQGGGIRACYRVLSPEGRFVLTDLFSLLLAPTLLLGRRDRTRTRHRADALLRQEGFRVRSWHRLYSGIISTVVAEK